MTQAVVAASQTSTSVCFSAGTFPRKAFVIFAVTTPLSTLCLAQGEAVPLPFQDQMAPYGTLSTLSQWAAGKKGDYFGGNIVVDGAGIPPMETSVAITCNGKERLQTTADAKGIFVVQANLGEFTQTSQNTLASFAGCEVTAAAQGYKSNILTIQQHTLGDSPNIGTLHLHRTNEATPVFFSATGNTAPLDAVKAYNSALTAGSREGAIRNFERAVQIYPQYAQAWYALAVFQQPKNVEDAKSSYQKAVAADASFVLPYIQLAGIASQQQKWPEAAAISRHAVTLCPKDCPAGWYLNSVANYRLGRFYVAETSARQGLAIDTHHSVPLLEESMAVILTHEQKFSEAADHLRNYLEFAPHAPEAKQVRAQLVQVERTIAEVSNH